MKKVYLICNAHLDPMWLWEWEEGAAAALSTFRSAVGFCEKYHAFVFNHNEALLYKWIEEYEPELFERIRIQVRKGRWKMMGGWYLQPDCLMPSGEGFVRQITEGNRYFEEKFGVTCKTAVNFDSFGHSRGLVQILKKCGYENYLICRPTKNERPDLPEEFDWKGFDESTIRVHRHFELYNSPLGKAAEKIEHLISENEWKEDLMILWGVGNHGGGPSRKDIEDIASLQVKMAAKGVEMVHSSPDDYFEARKDQVFPILAEALTPCNTGCLSSMSLIKQKYRKLENELFFTEKLASCAYAAKVADYPTAELHEAIKDLLFLQFHDILPGSAISPVEEAGLRIADHALEILSRLRARLFFACSSGIRPKADCYPVLVFNPHPNTQHAMISCEFQLADQNWGEDFTYFHVFRESGEEVPSQIGKEYCNLNLDWRKRVIFETELSPMSMNVFFCHPYRAKKISAPKQGFCFQNGDLVISFHEESGWINSIKKNGEELLSDELRLFVHEDTEDPWAMQAFQYRELGAALESFRLMSRQEAKEYAHIKAELPALRVIEDGPVRTVVEGLYCFGHSFAVIHYIFGKQAPGVEIAAELQWNEKDRLLKWHIPLKEAGHLRGETAFGVQDLFSEGGETDHQRYCTIRSGSHLISLINTGTYAVSLKDGVLMPTLLRSPAYSGHPIENREILHQDRYTPRMDQGRRTFTLRLDVDPPEEEIGNLAQWFNQPPYALSFFPSGAGERIPPLLKIESNQILLSTCKKADRGSGLILRLVNGAEIPTECTLSSSQLSSPVKLKFGACEVRTFRMTDGRLIETNMKEQDL